MTGTVLVRARIKAMSQVICMRQHTPLLTLAEEFPQVSLYAYLDDLSVTGEVDDLVAVAKRFKELAYDRGLVVNLE